MSDLEMLRDKSTPNAQEAELVDRSLDRLESGWTPQASHPGGEEDQRVRQHLEAISLLAYTLEPLAPAEGSKARLMAAIAGPAHDVAPQAQASEARPSAPESGAFPTPSPPKATDSRITSPVDMTLQHRVDRQQLEDSSVGDSTFAQALATSSLAPDTDAGDMTLVGLGTGSGKGVPPTAANDSSPWARRLLVAALMACLLGLGLLYGKLEAANKEIQRQQQYLAQLPNLNDDMTRIKEDLELSQSRLHMVTVTARQAYRLQNVKAKGPSKADGIVYVCGQHQQWYLSLSGLPAPPEGSEYRLWFITADGPVDAGAIDIQGDITELEATSMPLGTEGFSVTVEPIDDLDRAPGEIVLLGDRPVKL